MLFAGPFAIPALSDLHQLPGLDVGMSQKMRLQVGTLVKVLLTDRASVRGIVHMEDLMHGQGARLTKSFATFSAFEWLFFGVNVSVVTQVVLSAEGFTADITVEGSFVSMCAFVNQQVV